MINYPQQNSINSKLHNKIYTGEIRLSKLTKNVKNETLLSLSELVLRLDMWSDVWEEKKKGKDEDYVIPDSGSVGIRFPKELAGKRFKVYIEK